jgi:hypothetical protein
MMNQMNELLLLYLIYELLMILKKNLNMYVDDDVRVLMIYVQNFEQVQMMIHVLNNDNLNHHYDILKMFLYVFDVHLFVLNIDVVNNLLLYL